MCGISWRGCDRDFLDSFVTAIATSAPAGPNGKGVGRGPSQSTQFTVGALGTYPSHPKNLAGVLRSSPRLPFGDVECAEVSSGMGIVRPSGHFIAAAENA